VKYALRGRALGADLADDQDSIVDRLCRLGVEEPQASNLAQAAVKFADEETKSLLEELTPEASWLGRAVCRRHVLPSRRTMYRLLQRQTCSWHPQAALIE
jgi:hypothetical protein